MAYIITAFRQGECIRETRLQKASAAVLAMKLEEEGCAEVAISDQEGLRLTLAEFQRRHTRAWRFLSKGPTAGLSTSRL